jgi:MFS family permease
LKTIVETLYAAALTLWVGGLWAIGYIVAPTLFAQLGDRVLAGTLAGKLFALIAYIGIGCAAYLLLFKLARLGAGALKQAPFWIILLMLVLIAAGQFGITPILDSLKAQALPQHVMESVFRDRFTAWHGVSSVLYLIVSVFGALLVYFEARPR